MIAQLNKEYILANPSKVFPRLLSYFFYEGRPATTKGRWFNPVTLLSLRSAAKTTAISKSENPVFITGTGRSGSTMLGLVLSIHPDVGFLNEPKALWHHANPNDDIIGSYSNGPADYIMKSAHALPEISNRVKAMYSSFLNRSGSSRIVDKFPEMIFRIEYLNTIFKNSKYIFLYRNPWETISSTALWSEKNAHTERSENWWGKNERKWKLLLEQVVPFDSSLAHHADLISELTSQHDKAAVEWVATMNYGIKMMQKFPDRILPVKYEHLCHNPIKVLSDICAFTDLDENASFLDFGKQVIQATPSKTEPVVHPVLYQLITELSVKLGYANHSPSISVTESTHTINSK